MYLVIGGSGFIGTRLCKRFNKTNKDFIIIDKQTSQAFPQKTILRDIRNKNSILQTNIEAEISILINLAAEHRDDVRPKSLYDEVNIQGARNTCDFAESKNIKKIIFTSSVAVYGFAEKGTDETGKIDPFNDYGRTKYEAELIYKKWQEKDPANRSLIIIRPTVVFGEQNKGNVYNLLKQIASGKFTMIGNGQNRKSMAYVENIAAFIQHTSILNAGIHTYNYIDKPDFNMNQLVSKVKETLGKKTHIGLRIPYSLGILIGYGFDILAYITKKQLPISSIRIQKFCKDSIYNTSLDETGFSPPVDLEDAILNTIKYEFNNQKEK